MKIFYCCYGSAHSSVVAASIHLGLLTSERIPGPKELMQLPHFDKTESFEIGTPFFMGKDEYNSDVFILGMASQRKLIKRAVKSFIAHTGNDLNQLMMVDTLKNVNFLTKLGGFISRRLGLVVIGRPLVIAGIQQRYNDFVKQVEKVKEKEKKILSLLD